MIKKILIIVALLVFSKSYGQSLKAMPAAIEFEHFNLIKVNPKYNYIEFIALMKAKDSIHKLLESTDWPSVS